MDNNINPWKGLEFYVEEDTEMFFGRSVEVEELYNAIKYNTQTIIYGRSGTGKTSILNAGIFNRARKEYFLPISLRLTHNVKLSYTQQIIDRIKEEIEKSDSEIENKILPIDENNISLWEFLHTNLFWSKDNFPLVLLFVIDQFEEFFTLAKDENKVADFFEQLSDMCDNKMPKYINAHLNENNERYIETIPHKMVICLREDFLSYLEQRAKESPALRQNRFCIKEINGLQAMEIIMEPGKEIITEGVAFEIVKKVASITDLQHNELANIVLEPSILSLFCRELNNKRLEHQEDKITFELVKEFGDNIIANFYDNAMSKLSFVAVEYLEEHLITLAGFRNSVALANVLANGVTQEDLEILKQNRIIRENEWYGEKRIEYTHDVICKEANKKKKERSEKKRYNALLQKNKQQKIMIWIIISIILSLPLFFGVKYIFKEVKRENIVNSFNSEQGNNFVLVESGTFQMGSKKDTEGALKDEYPVHEVTLNTFYIMKYQVTQELWEAVMGENPSYFNSKNYKKKKTNKLPVEMVSWNDIVGTKEKDGKVQDSMKIGKFIYYENGFVYKLNKKTNMQYRLPTEAEWEYAAKGGNKSRGYIYSGCNIVDSVAWYSDNSKGEIYGIGITHDVGGKKINELGIHDMSGNIWEWCYDWYDERYYYNNDSINPVGPNFGTDKVCRGGWWGSRKSFCRVTQRYFYKPHFRLGIVGFRLVYSENTNENKTQ